MNDNQPHTLSDHDLLVTLTVTVNNMREEIKSSNNDFSNRQLDMETRLRVVERDNEQLRGSRNAMRWMIAVSTAITTIIAAIAPFIVVSLRGH